MNILKKKVLFFLITSIVFLYYGWISRNLAFCGFGGTFFLLTLVLAIKKLQNFLIPIIAISFIISLIELSLNKFWFLILPENPRSAVFTKDSNFRFQKVDGFGYIGIEGNFKETKVAPNGEIIYDVIHTIGKDGYRLDVPGDDFQIYIYGDSFLFGTGLNDRETLSYYLNKNHNLKSKNLGMGGYGMHQALYNIQKGITSKKGLNILYTSPGHSHRSACIPAYSLGTPRYLVNDNKKLIRDGVCKNNIKQNIIFQTSYIFKLIDIVFAKKNNFSDKNIEIYLEILKEFSRLTKNNQSKLMIVYILSGDDDEKMKQNTKWSNNLIVDQYKKISDITLNLTLAETYEQLLNKYYIHKLDTHPTAEANIKRAKIIADVLNQIK